MSEYRWYVKQIWIGVEGPPPARQMLGVIKRSGWCHQMGQFCHVKVSVNGKKVWASGAEDRIWYMHLVEWEDIGEKLPQDIIPAYGWSKDGNTYAYNPCVARGYESFPPGIYQLGGGLGFIQIDKDNWRDEWENNPLTLIQKGAHFMYNWYYALVDRNGEPAVTLPNPSKSNIKIEDGIISGLEGGSGIWNGPPPLWCVKIVEVKSKEGWRYVKDEEKTTIWERNDYPLLSKILAGEKFWDIDAPLENRLETITNLRNALNAEHELLIEEEPADQFHACVLLGALNVVDGLLEEEEK